MLNNKKKEIAPIAITAGSRQAIGTELLCKAWRYYSEKQVRGSNPKNTSSSTPSATPSGTFSGIHWHYANPHFFFIGASKEIKPFNIPFIEIDDLQEVKNIFPRALPILKTSYSLEAIESIDIAIDSCRRKNASAMVTLPVEKKIFPADCINKGGSSGHTEYIAHRLGVKNFAMLMVASSLRVMPLTRHIPLARALAEINEEAIVAAARLLNSELVKDFALKNPRLALAGVNPHAGEGGLCGDEEQEILIPALKRLRNDGIDISGPHPADSLFLPHMRKTFDCAINIYHDQALIPIKIISFNRAVNVTLGLPIVRTSPDHGTARELVGKGIADAGSLIAAIELAHKIARRREKTTN